MSFSHVVGACLPGAASLMSSTVNATATGAVLEGAAVAAAAAFARLRLHWNLELVCMAALQTQSALVHDYAGAHTCGLHLVKGCYSFLRNARYITHSNNTGLGAGPVTASVR